MGSSNHNTEDDVISGVPSEIGPGAETKKQKKSLKRPKVGGKIAIPTRSLSNASADSLDTLSTHDQISNAFTARQRRKDALARSMHMTKEDVEAMKGPYEASEDDLALFEDQKVLKKKTKLKVKKLLKESRELKEKGETSTVATGKSTLSSLSAKSRTSRLSHTSTHSSRLSRAQREKEKEERKNRQNLIKSSLFEATDNDILNEPDLLTIPKGSVSIRSKASKSSRKSSSSGKKKKTTTSSSTKESSKKIPELSMTSSSADSFACDDDDDDLDDAKSFGGDSVDDDFLFDVVAKNKEKLKAIIASDGDEEDDGDDEEDLEDEDFDLEDYEYVAMMMELYGNEGGPPPPS